MNSAELLLTAAVALLVFGPKKLPMLATHLALVIRKIRQIRAQASALWQQQTAQLTLEDNLKKAEEADKKYAVTPKNPQ